MGWIFFRETTFFKKNSIFQKKPRRTVLNCFFLGAGWGGRKGIQGANHFSWEGGILRQKEIYNLFGHRYFSLSYFPKKPQKTVFLGCVTNFEGSGASDDRNEYNL